MTDDRDRQVSEHDKRNVRKAIEQPLRMAAFNEAEIREICREEIRIGLGSIGFNTSTPEAQAATAAEVAQWRATYATLASVIKKALLTAVGSLVAGFMGLLWLVVRQQK